MSEFRVELQRTSANWRLLGDDGPELSAANAFLASIAIRGLSLQTMRAYAFDLLHLFRWLSQERRELALLGAKDLLGFIDFQRKVGASANTINRRLVTTRLLYRFHMQKDLGCFDGGHYKGRGRDHSLGIHCLPRKPRHLRVKVPQKIVEPLTPEEIRRFFRHLKRYRDIAITQLLLLCGLRASELRSIRMQDLNLKERRLLIRGKGMKERYLPLPPCSFESITRYLKLERPETRCSEHLFVILQGRCRGMPMSEPGLRSLFRQRRQHKTLAGAHPHRFRHTFGADMARAGVRLPVLQKMMGHASGTTTLQYINLSMVDVAEAYEAAMQTIAGRYQNHSNKE